MFGIGGLNDCPGHSNYVEAAVASARPQAPNPKTPKP